MTAMSAWGSSALSAAAMTATAMGEDQLVGTVTVTMPPMAAESGEEVMHDMGRVGFHVSGHYWLLGDSHYVWYTLDGVGFDPGAFDLGLSSRSGILVAMVGGSRTAPQVAAATATAIDATGGLSASPSIADVAITGATTASAGTRDVDSADQGILGMPTSNLAGLNNFSNSATGGALLDSSSLPSGPFIVTGLRFTIGDLHTDQVTVAVYQGGGTDADFNGAALLGVAGTTSGSATLANAYSDTPAPFEVDPSAGRIWVMWSHASAAVRAPYPLSSSADPIHVAARNSSDWVISGSTVTREINTIALTSDPDDWPATLGAVTNSTVGMPPISLSYVETSTFQNDMRVVVRFGTRATAAALISTSEDTLLVGNSFTSPAVEGMTILDAHVAYGTHFSGSDYRVSLGVGGTADNDFSGAVFEDVGLAGGTSTGWAAVSPLVAAAVPASSRIFVTVHHLRPASDRSTISFDALTPDAYSPSSSPAAYFNGNTTESEFDDGTLGGTPSTNVSFDEDVAQAGAISPNGTLYNNDNSVGVRMRCVVLGFSVAP